jgi:MFS family permease
MGTGSLLLAFSPSVVVFGTLALLLGAGGGLYFTVGTMLVTDHFEDTGQALGIHSVGGPLAGLLFPIAAAYIGVRYGWRPAITLGAALAFPVFGLFVWRVNATKPGRPDVRMRERVNCQSLRAALTRQSVMRKIAIGVVGYFAWNGVASFFPTFLVEYADLTSGRASLLFGAIFALGALGNPVLGRLSETYPRDLVIAAAFLLQVVGFGLHLGLGGLVPTVLGMVLLGIGISWPGVLNS